MSLEERIVSNSRGAIQGDGITGTIQAKNLYTFFAVTASETDMQEVAMVLPIGGAQSGLYRFPRVGERVLVDTGASGRYYLLGYVPSESNDPFAPVDETATTLEAEKAKLSDAQGAVFRYRKTGENASADGYSEIGFYHKETRWKAPDEKEEDFPKIDRINIQSTGDIRERAENHLQNRAKRFEILVDCDETDDTRPLGDAEGDDPFLYAGDAHIRAKNRLILKAGRELRLQVGRSAIVISDEGITITTKKTQKNVALPWDTVINLTPRDGITLFGQNVNVGAAYNFTLRESAGGAISSLGGVMRLSARDLLAQSYCKVGYQANMTDFMKLYAMTARGMQAGEGDVPSYTSLTPSLAGLFSSINWGYYASTTNYSDMAGDYAALCGTLLQLLSLTYTGLDLNMTEEMKAQNGGRDAFNQAALADMQEKVEEMLSYINNAGDPARAAHNSFMHLTSSADAVFSGYDNERLSVNIIDSNVPLAGTSPSLIAKETARLQKENSAAATLREALKDEKKRIEDGALWALEMGNTVEKLKEL
ncbi:MAG: hypothetical protein LBD37_06595 [Treponema sp.]|jgi:hypothetical protein|nr:hypothetical protein [Treponema sp.]